MRRVAGMVLIGLVGMVVGGSVAWAQVRAHEVYEPAAAEVVSPGDNVFLHAQVKASPHWSDRGPQFAVDGAHDDPGNHWAAENIPVWLTVELKEPRDINVIRLWTFWDNRRYYQYAIEGSLDGNAWIVLADRRDNTSPAMDSGETVTFPTVKLQYVRTTFTKNSVGNGTGGHIVEIEGYCLDEQRLAQLKQGDEAWGKVPAGLQGMWGTVDERYGKTSPPSPLSTSGEGGNDRGDGGRRWSVVAWRGERVHGQIVLYTRTGAAQVRIGKTALESDSGDRISAECVKPAFVRYVLADRQIVPDVLDDATRLDIAARSVRPVWVSVDVPATAKPGKYRGQVVVAAQGNVKLPFELQVEVLPLALPPPAEWKFRLDLWQNPFAVARYHHVEPWSPEHLGLLEPHLKLLASAGQKCITTTIVWQAWGTQTYDPYDTMVQWTRRKSGKWAWDYGAFDKYVELCMRCGITDSISCYTIRGARFLDEATGDYGFTGGPVGGEWQPVWEGFLRNFVAHLKQKGWLGRAAIAMDEWPMDSMKPAIAFIRKTAPELKIALAGSNEPRLKDDIDDWCVFIAPPLDPAIARERATKGRPTTFYVCCGPGKPNTFTFSPPAEAAWLGWYAAAKGYSGLLRWAYDSFVQDPLYDTSFVSWPAGDCFLVYPGARSSIRFERLKEGIQDFEKVRILRKTLGKAGLKKLDEALAGFDYERVQREPAAEAVRKAKATLNAER